MQKIKDPGKLVYKMLRFQYAPIEKRMKEKAPELYKEYLTFSYTRRIAILDIMQSKGL